MKKKSIISILFLFLSVLSVNSAHPCFGDKLGLAHLEGETEEFSANLIAIYIKEKTGIDSIVNKFDDFDAVNSSLKKDETDIVILAGSENELNIEKLGNEHSNSKFFTLVNGDGINIVIRVTKKRLEDIKFFTLNKVMERIGRIITADELKKRLVDIKIGGKFPKQAAREYLVEKDLI